MTSTQSDIGSDDEKCNGDGYTICSVYGDYVTTLSVVESPVLHFLAYPRGAVAIHTVDAYGYEPTAIELFPQWPETHTVTRGVSREKCVSVTVLRKACNK